MATNLEMTRDPNGKLSLISTESSVSSYLQTKNHACADVPDTSMNPPQVLLSSTVSHCSAKCDSFEECSGFAFCNSKHGCNGYTSGTCFIKTVECTGQSVDAGECDEGWCLYVRKSFYVKKEEPTTPIVYSSVETNLLELGSNAVTHVTVSGPKLILVELASTSNRTGRPAGMRHKHAHHESPKISQVSSPGLVMLEVAHSSKVDTADKENVTRSSNVDTTDKVNNTNTEQKVEDQTNLVIKPSTNKKHVVQHTKKHVAQHTKGKFQYLQTTGTCMDGEVEGMATLVDVTIETCGWQCDLDENCYAFNYCMADAGCEGGQYGHCVFKSSACISDQMEIGLCPEDGWCLWARESARPPLAYNSYSSKTTTTTTSSTTKTTTTTINKLS